MSAVDHMQDDSHPPVKQQSDETTSTLSMTRGPNFRQKYILSGHGKSISSLKFSPDGSLLASSGQSIMHYHRRCDSLK